MRKFGGLPNKKRLLAFANNLNFTVIFAKSLAYSTFTLPLKVKGNNVYNF